MPRLFIHADGTWQRTHGGPLRFGSVTRGPFFLLGEFDTPEKFAQRDRLNRSNYWHVGGGVSCSAGPVDIFRGVNNLEIRLGNRHAQRPWAALLTGRRDSGTSTSRLRRRRGRGSDGDSAVNSLPPRTNDKPRENDDMRRRTSASLAVLPWPWRGRRPGDSVQLQPPLPSPNATVAQTIGVTKVEVALQPAARQGPDPQGRARVIWGALVPYDQVWRTGANAATKITFGRRRHGRGAEARGRRLRAFHDSREDRVDGHLQQGDDRIRGGLQRGEGRPARARSSPRRRRCTSSSRSEFPAGDVELRASSRCGGRSYRSPSTSAVDTQACSSRPRRTPSRRQGRRLADADRRALPLPTTKYARPTRRRSSTSLTRRQGDRPPTSRSRPPVPAGERKKKEAVAAAQRAMALKDADPKPSPTPPRRPREEDGGVESGSRPPA